MSIKNRIRSCSLLFVYKTENAICLPFVSGMSYALREAGFGMGLVLVLIVTFVTGEDITYKIILSSYIEW